MNVRPDCPARGWLFCAATSLMMIGPSTLFAQNPLPGGSPAARPAAQSTQKKPNPLFGAFKKLTAKRPAKPAAAPQPAGRKPSLLPFLGLPASNAKPAKKVAPPVKTADAPQGRPSYRRYVPRKRVVRQTAANQPTAAPTKKPGIIDRLLGLDKPQTKPKRVVRKPATPVKPQVAAKKSSGLSGIPNLLPSFLRPKQKTQRPRVASQPRPVRYQPRHQPAPAQPPTLVLSEAESKAKRLAEFDNPFPEVTEAEADRKVEETPFSGLTLAEPEEFELPAVEPASGTDDIEVTIKQRAGTDEELPVVAESQPQENPHEDKLQKLAERSAKSGLKGFCPVALRDSRDLIDADAEFTSTYDGATYHFSSAEARAKFDADPEKYAPAHSGHDLIVLTDGEVELQGSLENAVWFRDRLYLFSSTATLETFVASPEKYIGSTGDESDDVTSETDEPVDAPDFGDADEESADVESDEE